MSIKNLTNNIIQNLTLPELHLVLGGLPASQTEKNSFNPEADALIARRVNNLEKCLIADNNIWQSGKQYNAWTPEGTTNYYIYNPENRIVYLCTDNKPQNRVDEEAGLSTYMPSHVEPQIQTYEDGYSWIPLFMVDISQLDFLSERDLPIPDLSGTKNYLTFTEKYSSLCGSGVTAFGCCCLYFKENSVDDITGEVYTAGDVTNETIFSDCFECQKLAEALDREVIFLSGLTAGGLTLGHTTENPLCPTTKQIKTLKEQLETEKYTLSPGSSREYALYLLNNFNNDKGLMSARIDLSNTTLRQTAFFGSPSIVLLDKTGTGGLINFITTPVFASDLNTTIESNYTVITGVQLTSSGKNYTDVIDYTIDGINVPESSHILARSDLLKIITFPDNFYNDPTLFVPAKRIRVRVAITSDEIADNVATDKIRKFGILVNPKFYGSDAPAIFPEGDSAFRNLQTIAFAATGPVYTIE